MTRSSTSLLPELLTPVTHRLADRGRTRKTLWECRDGSRIESVLMRYPDRITVCVSSQAGCGMACPFCATGQGGLRRNLSTAEIVHQVVAAQRAVDDGELAGGPGRVANVVFMGMGEPLANYRRLLGAIERLTDPVPHGLGLSQRHVTVSTVGLVPGIKQLADLRLGVRLAVSLHAPDDELRDTLVPVNNRWPVREVLAAAWGYAGVTGRRVSIEYALIRGINDQPERADHLAIAARRSARAREPDSAQPDARAASGTRANRRSSASSYAACVPAGWRRRSATPAAATSTERVASSRRPARHEGVR